MSQRRELLRARNRIPPEELALYQADPLREVRLHNRDFVVCRECGGRQLSLQIHVKLHGLTLQKYSQKWISRLLARRASKRKLGTTQSAKVFYTVGTILAVSALRSNRAQYSAAKY
jgi:hypothetical protein